MPDRTGAARPDPTPARQPAPPWYARAATTGGRPLVLTTALAMCAPADYHLAKYAGWTGGWALGMPLTLSAYAGIAAVVASTRPPGARGRASAIVGALLAIVLALAAQIVAHLIGTGHMTARSGWLVAIVSAVPPAVVGHLLHLAATPVPTALPQASQEQPTPAQKPADAPSATPVLPPMPTTPPTVPAPIVYDDQRCYAIRPLYNTGYRPGTAMMRAALVDAGFPVPGDGTIRGVIRAEVETREPHLGDLPSAHGVLGVAR
jgi:hypothetical protein